jgi:hypothetical protein
MPFKMLMALIGTALGLPGKETAMRAHAVKGDPVFEVKQSALVPPEALTTKTGNKSHGTGKKNRLTGDQEKPR